MKKLIIVCKGNIKPDELCRTEDRIKRDLDRQGFALLDDRYEIHEIDTGKEDTCDN